MKVVSCGTAGTRRQPAVRFFRAMTLAALGLAAPCWAGEPAGSLEYPVKASLLLSFAKFTEWPSGSSQAASPTVTICVLGPDPFGRMLEATVEGRTVGGRGVQVRRFQQLDGIENCHVLFVASSEMAAMSQILGRIRESPVLSVGEAEDFLERGGVIGLSVEDNHARFSVNLAPTRASMLRLSSQLLNVARSVRQAVHP